MDRHARRVRGRPPGPGQWPRRRRRTAAEGPYLQHALGTGELLCYVNARTTLHSGDVFFAGTPAGVGHETGKYLRSGQTVVVTVEGIGTLVNTVGRCAAT
ncbi:fumarylacetoacetate hydrolase family protein [Streptomyces sp. NPDC020379]|uniref:fumarylacetoacetate hydrolase family protein n=1 Tax=Streptomyces sp. NPDC020379 TaxID=3365071 RepID=UPI00379EF9F8